MRPSAPTDMQAPLPLSCTMPVQDRLHGRSSASVGDNTAQTLHHRVAKPAATHRCTLAMCLRTSTPTVATETQEDGMLGVRTQVGECHPAAQDPSITQLSQMPLQAPFRTCGIGEHLRKPRDLQIQCFRDITWWNNSSALLLAACEAHRDPRKHTVPVPLHLPREEHPPERRAMQVRTSGFPRTRTA